MGSPALMVSTHQATAEALVVRVVGEVDLATAGTLETSLAGITASAPPPLRLIVDLSGVSFMGSAGLTILVSTSKDTDARGVRLCVVAPVNSRAHHVLDIAGLIDMLSVADDLDEALALR